MSKYMVFWKEYHHEEIEAESPTEAQQKVENMRKRPTFDGFAGDIMVEKEKVKVTSRKKS